jgi:hypothetical protein
MTSTLVDPYVCHDSILWRLRDFERVVPKHGAHLPPATTSPSTDLPPEPWESFMSNETGCPAFLEALYQRPLLLDHLPSASIDVMEVPPTVMDPCL